MSPAASAPPPTPTTAEPRSPEARAFGATFFRLVAVQSSFGVSFSAFLLLPKFLRTELDASASEIGWMSGTSLAAAAVASPIIGNWMTKIRRRTLITFALVLEGLAAFAFVTVDAVDAWALTLRVMQGVAFVLVFNGTTSWVADVTPRRILARALGYLGTAMLVTNALAPLAMEPLAAGPGWTFVFVAAGVTALLAPLLLIGLEEPCPPEEDPTARETSARGIRRSAPILYGSLMMGSGIGVMFTFVQPFALEQGAIDVGQMFLGYAAAAAGVRLFFGGWADRLGPARMAGLALAVYSATVLATAAMTPQTVLWSGVGLGVAHGFLYPALNAAGLQAMSLRDRPRFLGWFSCGFNSGFALTVLILGPVADHFGYPAVFISTGIALATAVVPTFRFRSTAQTWQAAGLAESRG